jgi:hypothetical protein
MSPKSYVTRNNKPAGLNMTQRFQVAKPNTLPSFQLPVVRA